MMKFPIIKQLGEQGILVEFEPEIGEKTLGKVLAVKDLVIQKRVQHIVEIIPTYTSLLITYANPIEDVYSESLWLKKEITGTNLRFNFKSSLYSIPVCYEDHFAPDLEEISKAKGLSKEEIIKLHSGVEYLVYFTGFLPGFLYLGGLPEKLHFSRRSTPRPEVPKGAVGIGEKQTGIYPQSSPGGWNIIGNSPVKLFEPLKDPPCEINAGDKIKFYPVSWEEHEQISRQVELGNFALRKEENFG